MPYIKQEEREGLDYKIDALSMAIETSGQMNYVITRLLHKFDSLKEEPSYSKINTAIGVTECVKLELYRMIAVLYENKKMRENGNV